MMHRTADETIAMFLEGRFRGADRERVMRWLLTSPEDYEVFVNTAVVLRELGG